MNLCRLPFETKPVKRFIIFSVPSLPAAKPWLFCSVLFAADCPLVACWTLSFAADLSRLPAKEDPQSGKFQVGVELE